MENRKRVKYKKSPLIEVIFQLRFPTILSINSKQPDTFQEKVRIDYPFYEEGIEQQNEVLFAPDGNPTQIKKTQNKNYAFISADRKYKINLTSSFIALSTTAYTQWEEFWERIQKVKEVFESVYNPAFYTRVGLRYIDVIVRSNLGLMDRKWNELIKPHVLGIVTPEIEDGVQSYLSEAEFTNDDQSSHTKVHFEFVHVNDSLEISLLLDCDHFVLETIKLKDIDAVAQVLHSNSSNFIGNAITDMLNDAMEPEPI